MLTKRSLKCLEGLLLLISLSGTASKRKTAAQMEISVDTVTKYVVFLEACLGCKLLINHHNCTLTAKAKELVEKSRNIYAGNWLPAKQDFNLLNLKNLKPDMVKLFWEPLLEFEPFNPKYKEIIDTLGKENFILAKCDSQAALKWGISYGITTFQGPFMDNIETAVIRGKCPDAAKCSAQQCLKRRKSLSALMKAACSQPEILEDML